MIDWRFLTLDDIEWVTKVGEQMFAESEWKEGEYDAKKIEKYLHHVASHPLYMCGLIGLKDDEKAGFLIGQIGEYRFMNKLVARENELCVLCNDTTLGMELPHCNHRLCLNCIKTIYFGSSTQKRPQHWGELSWPETQRIRNTFCRNNLRKLLHNLQKQIDECC